MTDDPKNIDQAVLIHALLDPALYQPAVHRVEKMETHISYVLLAGDYVYKIKKSVDFGFLNFSTLAARHFFCTEELRLNQRLAPSLYLDVIPIGGTVNNPTINGGGEPIEWAVKMRRFAQEQLLDRIAESGHLAPAQIDQLAIKIAEFHARVSSANESDQFGTPAAILKPVEENFPPCRALSTASSSVADLAELDYLQVWTANTFRALQDIFIARKRHGFIRECHGDLHLGNIALIDGEVTPFDCLEFSESLRWIDVMSEVAFLVMDLRHRAHADLANRFLNRYLETTGDYRGLQVLRFYIVYRALVRAKINCLRALQSGISAQEKSESIAQYRSYLALAKNQTRNNAPVLMIAHGLSGSGKTTCSQSLLELSGAIRIRSDVERKRLHGLNALTRSGAAIDQGLYTADVSTDTYQYLLDTAQHCLESGYSVFVDATFLKHEQRQIFSALAMRLSVKFFIIDFCANEDSLRTRINQRIQHNNDASDADIAVLEKQIATQQPLTNAERTFVFTYDTDKCGNTEDLIATWKQLLENFPEKS